MTLQQLRYMIKIAECGSMSEAAAKLFISQPSLSVAIRDLENETGRTFFLRSNRGVTITPDGIEFLGYARQVLQQADLLESRYSKNAKIRQRFSVSTHHYPFTANAFVDLIKRFGGDEYEFALRETTTYGIIEDVKSQRSEIGILYLSTFNRQIITKLLQENCLSFSPLLSRSPHVFLYRAHPLAERTLLKLEELDDYPCISYDQGIHNSFYYAEEILSARNVKKSIKVTDRAAVVNLLIGVEAYTIGTGIFPSYLHGQDIIAIPLDVDEHIQVGIVTHQDYIPSCLGKIYLEALQQIASLL